MSGELAVAEQPEVRWAEHRALHFVRLFEQGHGSRGATLDAQQISHGSGFEQLGRCGFDFRRDRLRDVTGFHFAVVAPRDADNRELAGGGEFAVVAVQFVKTEMIGDRLGAQLRNEQVDLNFVLEAKRFLEIKTGVDARPADWWVEIACDY